LRDFIFRVIDKNDQVVEIQFPYVIVVSQDCDLNWAVKPSIPEQEQKPIEHHQFLPNVLLLPAFPSEHVRGGQHLVEVFNVMQKKISSDSWKELKQNRNERYHFLDAAASIQVPELVLDFKLYYTVPFSLVQEKHKECYLATVNELFRERLSQRFLAFFGRFALPVIRESVAATTDNGSL